MGNRKEYRAWKKNKKLADAVSKELEIPIKGFYNYYSVPWNPNLYIKFKVDCLLFPTYLASDGPIDFSVHKKYNEESFNSFLRDNYLGSARLTDKRRLNKILGNRKELKL